MILQHVFLLPFEILIVPTLSTSVALFLLGFTLLLDSNIEGLFSPIKMLRNGNGKNIYFGQTRLVEYSLNFTFSPLGKLLNIIVNAIAHFLAVASIIYFLLSLLDLIKLIIGSTYVGLHFTTGCYLGLIHSGTLGNKFEDPFLFDGNTVFFKKIKQACRLIQEEKLTSVKTAKIKTLCDKVLW